MTQVTFLEWVTDDHGALYTKILNKRSNFLVDDFLEIDIFRVLEFNL